MESSYRSRRDMLAGAAAAAVCTVLEPAATALAAGGTGPRRIDVHYHIAPPAWSEALKSRGVMQPAWKDWSVAKAVEDMDRDGIGLSLTSITIPGVSFGDADKARALARECNDFAARMRSDHPGRFGIFGALPLPDVEGSLAEIAYALDQLKADGIGLLTSYGDKWLGDPAFEPVFAELDRRKALIYTHPNLANCCRNLVPNVSASVVEYGTDTSRAISEIIFGGTARRHPDLRIIFSHAGGTLPFLVERLVVQARAPGVAAQLPDGPLAPLRKFYYDTAQAAMAPPMAALRKITPVSHILFGTDYPYRTAEEHVRELRQSGIFSAKELQAIEHDNAVALLPRHAA